MANKTIQCWCCNNNAKTCLLFAGIQIIYGMMYLIYSIVTWSIRFYPRVKSSLETYYAFGQPALIVIGGMGLILIVLACTDFSSKCFVGFFWTLLQLILLTITLYRLSEMAGGGRVSRWHGG
ncbi:unnamed protein product [Allacma fusca]|uniref:Uncharacterized protein n=1 Tax=Allacma fusca TaxID=39272 RepID=A0A8J2J154_9HEXA|nr:unnamed protein product [Allacma fusca]